MPASQEHLGDPAARSDDENPNTDAEIKRDRLLQEADDLLAQSYLIFLYSDLRLLSATGRVRIKFENLSIDSDNVQKNDAAELAVLGSEIGTIRKASTNEGISPAQIMAALMVELRREVQARRLVVAQDEEEDEDQLAKTSREHSIIATLSNRKNRKEVEEDMDSLLKAYNYMIGMDLKTELPSVKMRSRPIRPSMFGRGSLITNALQGLTGTDSKDQPQPSADDEQQDENDDTPKVSKTSDAALVGSLGKPKLTRTLKRPRRLSLAVMNQSFGAEEVGEVGDALFQMDTKGGDESLDRNLSEAEILDLMEDAVQSREYGELDFMRDFFREDSVSTVMVQSDTRIVWMNDWYPLKDLTFAVCVNKAKKEVLLVFRGAITKADWAHATNWNLKKVANPIEESYDGKPSNIDVHNGFFRYLFRVRKDTGTRKYDEITTVVHEYGSNVIGDYRLVVTGHSLGAALSTVFSMFASTDPRFTERGPIKMYTFGSPYVGGKKFLNAFRHQEHSRKIQYVRLHNVRDGVAHMPIGWRGKFQHVGVSSEIHRLPQGCNRWRGQLPPKTTYSTETGSWALYWKAFRENWFFNMPFPWNTAKAHTLHELRKRMIPAVASIDAKGLDITLEELYQLMVYEDKEKKKST